MDSISLIVIRIFKSSVSHRTSCGSSRFLRPWAIWSTWSDLCVWSCSIPPGQLASPLWTLVSSLCLSLVGLTRIRPRYDLFREPALSFIVRVFFFSFSLFFQFHLFLSLFSVCFGLILLFLSSCGENVDW